MSQPWQKLTKVPGINLPQIIDDKSNEGQDALSRSEMGNVGLELGGLTPSEQVDSISIQSDVENRGLRHNSSFPREVESTITGHQKFGG